MEALLRVVLLSCLGSANTLELPKNNSIADERARWQSTGKKNIVQDMEITDGATEELYAWFIIYVNFTSILVKPISALVKLPL